MHTALHQYRMHIHFYEIDEIIYEGKIVLIIYFDLSMYSAFKLYIVIEIKDGRAAYINCNLLLQIYIHMLAVASSLSQMKYVNIESSLI